VLQEAPDEFLGGQGAAFPTAGGTSAVTESDLAILEFEKAGVGEGDPKDIGCQILEGGLPRADWLTMDHPVLSPDLGGDLVEQVSLDQDGPELAAKQAGQRLDPDEKSVAGAPPALSIGG
jgi:hypothetical protein